MYGGGGPASADRGLPSPYLDVPGGGVSGGRSGVLAVPEGFQGALGDALSVFRFLPQHLGRSLGARAVYIPRQAGAFCAIGMQHADVRRDFVLVIMQELNEEIISVLAEGFKRLEKQAQDALKEEGFGRKNTEFGYELDLHYEGQQWDVRVGLASDAPPAK